jgi:hypothetical protein
VCSSDLDARPSLVLTTRAVATISDAVRGAAPELASARWLATDELPDALA